jgi:DNA-binding IclR family transcriptional regulator
MCAFVDGVYKSREVDEPESAPPSRSSMAHTESAKSPPPRVVGRLCIDFILRAVRSVSRHLDGDILGGLVVLALLQRELSQIAANEAPEQATPRPISVKSLARSLKSPPETMRRCVVRLIENGWCVRVDKQGIVLSQTASAREKTAALLTDIRNDFSLMLADLRSIDFDFDLMDRASDVDGRPDAETRSAAVRATSIPSPLPPGFDRVMLNFGLRVVDCGTTPFGNDYVLTCVFSAIMSANASPFAYDPREAWRYGSYTTPPPDNARRPANLTEISQILGIPYETARRYVNALIARGHCTRDARKGLLIPMDLLQSQPSILTGMEIVGRFVQMIGELKHLGFDFRGLPRGG